jgi:hypothetical protein
VGRSQIQQSDTDNGSKTNFYFYTIYSDFWPIFQHKQTKMIKVHSHPSFAPLAAKTFPPRPRPSIIHPFLQNNQVFRGANWPGGWGGENYPSRPFAYVCNKSAISFCSSNSQVSDRPNEWKSVEKGEAAQYLCWAKLSTSAEMKAQKASGLGG